MERLEGSWYSTLKRFSSTQYILARRASMRGSAAEASVLKDNQYSAPLLRDETGNTLAVRSQFTEDKGVCNHVVDGVAIVG